MVSLNTGFKLETYFASSYFLKEVELADLRESIETTNQQREPTQFIEDYAVLEQLGSGAFGSVCKVRKKDHGQSLYALKEVRLLCQILLGRIASR